MLLRVDGVGADCDRIGSSATWLSGDEVNCSSEDNRTKCGCAASADYLLPFHLLNFVASVDETLEQRGKMRAAVFRKRLASDFSLTRRFAALKPQSKADAFDGLLR